MSEHIQATTTNYICRVLFGRVQMTYWIYIYRRPMSITHHSVSLLPVHNILLCCVVIQKLEQLNGSADSPQPI